MIGKLTAVTKKSFDNYSSDDTLKDVNVFFGTNGSGKSALSQWLLADNPENTAIFDTDYVHKNILMTDEISGVKLSVGEKKVTQEQNIERIIEANKKMQERLNTLTKTQVKNRNKLYVRLNDYLQEARKRFDLNKNINQKFNAKTDPINAVKQWELEIKDDVIQSESSEQLQLQELQIKGKLDSLKIDTQITKQRLEKFVRSMKQEFLVPDQHVTKNVIGWLEEGLNIHTYPYEKTICEFCGNEFVFENVQKNITDRINTEHSIVIKALIKINDEFEMLSHQLKKLPQDVIENTDIIKSIEIIQKQIRNKQNNTMNSIVVDEAIVENIEKMIDTVEYEKKKLFKDLDDIQKQKTLIEVVAKSWIGKQLSEDENVSSLIEDIKKQELPIREHMEVISANEKWVSDEQQKTLDLMPFLKFVNLQLHKMGMTFELEIMDTHEHYLIVKKDEINKYPLKSKDLSEGERRLLGFLHFYLGLFETIHDTFKSTITRIIIDDAITSLDNDNKFYFTDLINTLIKSLHGNIQMFIFTHSSSDFHNFGYGCGTEKVVYFKIEKNDSGNSLIRKISARDKMNYSDYYQEAFRSAFAFALTSNKNLPTFNYRSFGNKARYVFESHARSHYKIEYATVGSIKELKKCYEISEEDLPEFTRMLNVINALSHGMTFMDEEHISARELRLNIRVMFKVLYAKDAFHVNQMHDGLVTHTNRDQMNEWIK